MSSPTGRELELIAQFRQRLCDLKLNEEQQSERYLLRWIRARDHDLPKAEEMLRNSLKWREANDIANLATWIIPANIAKGFPFTVSGLDHEGCPVGIMPLGAWDVRKAVEAGLRDKYVKYVDHIMVYQYGEVFRKQCSNDTTQLVIILDMLGYSFRQATSMSTLETIMETVKRFDLNHPETLKQAIVINAPKYFSIAFEIVKRVMSAKTLSKVHVFGTNSTKWQPFLLKYIPSESLPTYFGGSNSNAQNLLNGTAEISTDSDSIINNEIGSTVLTVTIEAGSKLHINADIHEFDSILYWSFKPCEYDIGFAIFYENEDEVHTYNRYHSAAEMAKGSTECKKLGKYTLVFDNSYSRFREKTVEYAFEIAAQTKQL